MKIDTGHQSSCVILLHGLARTRFSMQVMQRALQQQGYTVVNVNYPSRQLPVADLATIAIQSGLGKCRQQGACQVHFVTHSLGGILVRYYTLHQSLPELGRVVMLGPPNQGSHAVDKLKNLPGYSFLNGPAGMELGTSTQDLPKKLGRVNFALGVIAGRKSINPLLSTLIPGPDDGKVSVENTKIEGMKDFISLPVSHTFMMRNPQVISQTLYFLDNGRFNRQE